MRDVLVDLDLYEEEQFRTSVAHDVSSSDRVASWKIPTDLSYARNYRILMTDLDTEEKQWSKEVRPAVPTFPRR